MRHCECVRWHASLGSADTRLPLSSATWAHFCRGISGNRPRAVANRRQREGHRLPTSVTALGGPAASIQLRQGLRAAGGPRESAHCRPHSARRPGRAVRSCIWNWVAASQARCGRPETNAGPLLRAGAACKPVASIGPATGRASPRTVLAGMLVTDPQTRAACGSCMLRYQA